MRAFLRKLRWLTHRRAREAELHEELQFHLDEDAAQRHAQGAAKDEARYAALRELGNLARVEEDTRAVWGWTVLEQLGQDLRYAFRTMSTNRLFTVLVVVSLALGIGANTAIYSFVDSILLRSLPVADPGSLVILTWRTRPGGPEANGASGDVPVMKSMSGSTWGDSRSGAAGGIFPFPAFELFRENHSIFSVVFAHFQAWHTRRLNVAVHGQADVATGWNVSGDYFRGLGVGAAAGRLIVAEDDRADAPPVAVVSYGYGQTRFGNAANAPGQSILIDNLPFTVVGVTPPEFYGVDPAEVPEIYLPIHALELLGAGKQFGFRQEDYLDRNYYWIQVMGRLRPGVTVSKAQATLAPAFRHWVAGTAVNDAERANLPELVVRQGAGGLDSVRRRYSKPLYVLMTLVGLMLALACANVANLLLARSAARRREIALRLGLGAGRSRVVRQLLTESILLASLGGVLGLLFAAWGIQFLTLLLADGRASFTLHAELNWRVLGAAVVLSITTGALFGLAPALQATRLDVVAALKVARAGLRQQVVFRRVSLSHLLVVTQVAISVVILVAAGLFIRTLSNLESVNLGFNRENVLLFQLDARKAGHRDPEVAAFYGDLRRRFSTMPGVRQASLSEDSLIGDVTALPISVPGAPPGPGERVLNVGPAFFTTMQIPLLAGRDFDERDGPGSPAVAVINQAFARARFGDRNPLGQHLILWREGSPARDMEIVGVCGNARYGSLTADFRPVVYIAYDQGYPQPNQMVYALRTSGNPFGYLKSVREVVRRADPRVPVSEVRTQVEDIDRAIYQEITFARLCSAFAILALVIATVGLYAAVSYNVARRSAEIGIRMALGAERRAVVRMVLREVVVLLAAGLAIGVAMALAASKLVASFLFGLKPNDPMTLALAGMTLLTAALVAGCLPAWKASRIDPMSALRTD